MSKEDSNVENVEPYIPATTNLPEITIKSLILSVILSIVMGASNAYLGLKVGMTVSACIPAAVISMAVLKLFRTSNILENNIVQTTASAGEAVATAIVFTLPALVMIGYWDHFPPLMMAILTASGGILGVFLSVPLRQTLIIEEKLSFPEGVASAEVLQVGDMHREGGGDTGIQQLVWGGCLAAFFKFCQSGLLCVTESIHYWTFSGSTVLGFGTGFSPACIAGGYILGFRALLSLSLGSLLAWVAGVPLCGLLLGLPEGKTAMDAAFSLWVAKVRPMGVGTMCVGGVWLAFTLGKPLYKAVSSAFEGFRSRGAKPSLSDLPSTERAIPLPFIIGGICLTFVPVFFLMRELLTPYQAQLSWMLWIIVPIIMTVFVVLLSFLCTAISGYMIGILGSSHNPLSGVTIIAVLVLSGIMFFLLDPSIRFTESIEHAVHAAGVVVSLGCVVACSAAVGGDNLQDLKAGQLVGATPWKQQVMLIVGVVAASCTLAFVMELFFQAYGIGQVLPRPGMDPALALSAPKAGLMAALSQSIFQGTMDWAFFLIGAVIALLTIGVDSFLARIGSAWRLPVLGMAVGMYLPLDVTAPLTIGGLLSTFVDHFWDHKRASLKDADCFIERSKRRATLLCAGLIAGESLSGVILAIPFVIYQSVELFRWSPVFLEPFRDVLGLMALVGLCFCLYKTAVTRQGQ